MGNASRKTKPRKRTPKLYKANQEHLTEFTTDMTIELDYMVPCPRCTGRAFDFSGIPQGLLRVRLKCPHCHRLVEAPIINDSDVDTS